VLFGYSPQEDACLTGNLEPQLTLYASKLRGEAEGKLEVTVLVDDGGLIEAVNLGVQLLLFGEVRVFAFVFADLYRSELSRTIIRDPTAEERKLASSLLTIIVEGDKLQVQKTSGSPVALSDIQQLAGFTREWVEKAKMRLEGKQLLGGELSD
jgi:exosome complex RNA-binding protein Rrp42 (RNase PH superfamily)